MKFNLNGPHMDIKTHIILVGLVLIGAINWGLHAFGFNLVDWLSKFVNSLVNRNLNLDKIIYIVVAIAGIMLAINRNTWLPFLGKSVLPPTLVPLISNANANIQLPIKTKPNSKIAYWAAFNKSMDQDVITAYADYSNSGVVMSDENGNAVLSIKEGAEYIVPSGKTIRRHVHYRIIEPDAMMGKVMTIKY
jgi:uncharacterized membrane protein YuzA (DUF378 family)